MNNIEIRKKSNLVAFVGCRETYTYNRYTWTHTWIACRYFCFSFMRTFHFHYSIYWIRWYIKCYMGLLLIQHTFTYKIHGQVWAPIHATCIEVFGFTVIQFASVILVSKQIDDGTFVCCSTNFYLDSISKASQQ